MRQSNPGVQICQFHASFACAGRSRLELLKGSRAGHLWASETYRGQTELHRPKDKRNVWQREHDAERWSFQVLQDSLLPGAKCRRRAVSLKSNYTGVHKV